MSRPDEASIRVRTQGRGCTRALPFLVALSASVLPLNGLAAQDRSPTLDSEDLLATRLDRIVSDPALIRAHVGLAVQVAETGDVLYENEAEKRFVPASNTKIVTAAVALDALPTGFRWTTRIVADGPIRDGALQGDLWIIGGGDPVLSRSDVAGWTAILKKAGIKRINGDIIGDDRVFEDGQWGDGWMWNDVARILDDATR